MKKYVCDVCGWEYDPAVGDPDAGIEPGVAFEDLPEDFVCPLCGVGKDEFSPVDWFSLWNIKPVVALSNDGLFVRIAEQVENFIMLKKGDVKDLDYFSTTWRYGHFAS